jgi:DNA-binding response OmpR family regulator
MHDRHALERARILLGRTSRAMAILVKCLDDLDQLMQQPYGGAEQGRIGNLLGSQLRDPRSLYPKPLVDNGSMTVTWAGRTCHLRSVRLFGLIERLARRPNHYVSFDRLLNDVWAGEIRSDDTIRSSVRHLKRQLVNAGMAELAHSIRALNRRYVLLLNRDE